MLTPVNLAFEYAYFVERRKSNLPQAPNETTSLLLERMIKPLLRNTAFEIFQPFITKARLLLCSGHLKNAREVEVMLIAHSCVSASIVDVHKPIPLIQHRNIVRPKICIQTII